MFSSFIFFLYFLLLLVFVVGVIVVIYHLATFSLNRSFARSMIILLLVGAVVLLTVNLYFFSIIDWDDFFSLFLL